MDRLVVVGQGYVGLPVAVRACEAGFDVVGFDVDDHRIKRLEAACARALKFDACSYRSIESILKTGLDRTEPSDPVSAVEPIELANMRGADYFDAGTEVSHVN